MNPPPLLDYESMLEVIRAEAELLLASSRGQDPDLDVPHCPGLTLGETVRHTGSVYRSMVAWARSGVRPTSWKRAPDGETVEEYFTEGLGELLDELSAHDPRDPCATWFPGDRTFGFWRRRMMHETTVHRADVQAARGMPFSPVDDEVATDGVDEILLVWYSFRLAEQGVTGMRRGDVAVRTNGRSWLASAGEEAAAVRATSAEVESADAVVSGEPMQAYLWLWGRDPAYRTLDREGDQDAIGHLWALLRLATK